MNTQAIQTEKKKPGVLSWIIFVLSLIYAVSPVDLVPDGIPVLGWVDDFLFVATSALGLIQGYINDRQSFAYNVIRMLKFGFIVLCVIGVLLLILVVLGIISLFRW